MKDYVKTAVNYANRAAKDMRHTTHSKWVRLAAKRFLRDVERVRRKVKSFPYYFDRTHAFNACDFIEKLPHVEGQWDTVNIRLEPWFIFCLVNIFGWRRKADGYRRFNTVYLELARKNAKSTLAAGVALYCFTCEDEEGPQIKTAATTGDQARIVFEIAKKMIMKTPELAEAFELVPRANAIACYENNGSIKPINAKASTQDGLNPHMYVMDELHAHDKRDLFDVLKSARGARKNPLSFYITTAGYNVEGVCYEQRQLVEKILERVFDAEHYFGIIYTLDEPEKEVKDPKRWIKANPNLNVSVQLEELKGYYEESRFSPDSMGEFLTKRMNVWTSAKNAWLSTELWNMSEARYALEEARTAQVYGGLDLASVSDLTALAFVWRREDGTLAIYTRFYAPESIIKPRTEKGNVPYQRWLDAGYLTSTPGDVTDYAYVEKDVRAALEEYNIQAIGYDPWNAYDLVNRLTEDDAPMIEVRAGVHSFNAPMKELERQVKAKRIAHNENPVLRWCMSNLVARRDVNENLAPDRKNSLEKIDGAVAALMGIHCMLAEENTESVYETRGVVVL